MHRVEIVVVVALFVALLILFTASFVIGASPYVGAAPDPTCPATCVDCYAEVFCRSQQPAAIPPTPVASPISQAGEASCGFFARLAGGCKE